MINQGITYTLPYLGGFDTYFKHRHLIFINFSYTDVTIKFLYSKEKSELITLSLFLQKSALFSIYIVSDAFSGRYFVQRSSCYR